MIDQLRPAQLDAWLASAGTHTGQTPVLLDVREPWELQTASVRPGTLSGPAADHAPHDESTRGSAFELVTIPMNQIPSRLGELDPARPVACLCHHGVRSQRVALFLSHNGFRHVVNLAGGIDAWSAERDAGVARY